MKTGEITPRDLGVVINREGKKTFLSPARYAIARAGLMSKEEMIMLVENNGGQAEKFLQGVKKKYGAMHYVDENTGIIINAEVYAGKITAKVKSRSDEETFHEPQGRPNDISFTDTYCDCKEDKWQDIKGMESVCSHLATLEVAIYLDNATRKSARHNHSGLTPSKRKVGELPFIFTPEQIGTALIQYFCENNAMYSVSQELLQQETFNEGLERIIDNPFSDEVTIQVLRDREKEAGSHEEYHAGVRSTIRQIEKTLLNSGFKKDGYGIEFFGSDFETISRRYKQENTVYAICTREGMPPLIVRKHLGEKTGERFEQSKIENPFAVIGQSYVSTDMNTGRKSNTTIVLPKYYPRIISRAYKKLIK